MTNRKLIERELRRWLSTHEGVIGLFEVLALGGSAGLIRQKLSTGQWVRVFRAVYRDTAVPMTAHQALRAAWLATAGLGVVSHRSAAWLWGLLRRPPVQPELSVRTGSGDARLRDVTVHRVHDLEPSRASQLRGIPVTNPLRTLVDLAGEVGPAELTEAVDVAVAKGLITPEGLAAELARVARHGRPGVGAMRRHLSERGFIGAPAPSVLEAKMRRIIVAVCGSDKRIAMPGVEFRAGNEGRYRLDIACVARLFAVEVDGFTFHSSPEAKQYDEDRRDALRRQGWYVKVYDWRQVCREPTRVAHEIVEIYLERSVAR